MTREELEQIRTTTLHMAETPQRATLKSYVFRLVEALEAAWTERDTYKQHLARMLDEQAGRLESIGIRQSPEETAFWDKAERREP